MIRLVEAPGSDIFHKAFNEHWEDVCTEFHATNAAIVAATGDLIDINFRCWSISTSSAFLCSQTTICVDMSQR